MLSHPLHRVRRGGDALIALGILLAGLAWSLYWLPGAYRAISASGWEEVPAKMLACEMTTRQEERVDSRRRRYMVTIADISVRFSYQVAGKDHESNRFSLHSEVGELDESGGKYFLENYRVGAEVTAHYNPRDPTQAVLKVSELALLAYLVPLPGIAVFLFGLWLLCAGAREHARMPSLPRTPTRVRTRDQLGTD